MLIVNNEVTIFCDIDDTLIMYDKSKPHNIEISDPYNNHQLVSIIIIHKINNNNHFSNNRSRQY